MKKNSTHLLILIGAFSIHLVSQEQLNTAAIGNNRASATVTVLAFDTDGRALGAPTITRFESDDHKNFAGSFHQGVAEGIPFGEYRLQGYLPAYFSDSTHVAVFQQHVTVVLGLNVGYELPVAPPILRGRVIGLSGESTKKAFVKLTSVFAHESMDSAIGPTGEFELCGFSQGQYMLLVINDTGIIAGRVIKIPYTAPQLRIDVRQDHVFTKP
jgi:hypothetical protein